MGNIKQNYNHIPLAERMRPVAFSDFMGQNEIIGKDKPFREMIERDRLQSIIFWGPPGSGKTTLAKIIAKRSKAYFQPFPAVTSSIKELRQIIEKSKDRLMHNNQRTILFIDEIHRFNKAQQDAFLPHVENGTVILIGATTENPSFEVISPLVSRSKIFILKPLDEKSLKAIVRQTIKDKKRGLGNLKITVDKIALGKIVVFSGGDARILLNTLEFSVNSVKQNSQGAIGINKSNIDDILQKKILRYDKAGEEHYNIISAFIKSMRDSDPDGALYWLARMVDAGEDPRFIARRMVIFASEDVGNAHPTALVVANAVAHAVEYVGLPEAQINLAQGAAYLATCRKDNASYAGIKEAMKDVKKYGALPVPLHLRNAVTGFMKSIDYGKGYKYAHDFSNAKVKQEHLPEKLKGNKYYKLKE